MKMRKALDQPQNEMSPEYIIKHSEEICKSLNQLQFIEILANVYLEDITAIIHSVFMPGYHGKITNTKYFSEKHRNSIVHLLNGSKWVGLKLGICLETSVLRKVL